MLIYSYQISSISILVSKLMFLLGSCGTHPSGIFPAQPAAHCILLLLQAEQLSDRPGQPQPLPTLPSAEVLGTGHEQRWWDTNTPTLTGRQTIFFICSICLFLCVHFFALLSGEVRTDVQTSAGLSDRWSGEAPAAAAATAAASGRRPVRLVLPHQGPSRPLPTAPSAHGLLLHRGRRAAVLHRWCSPVPGVLPKRVAHVGHDLPRLWCLSYIEIPGEGGQRRTPCRKRWGHVCARFAECGSLHPPLLIPYLCLLLMSGFDSRQPSHDLMGIHPYNTLEDPYSLYPHSLRNIGERTAQHSTVG